MGWWGQHIGYKPSMREVKNCIESDTGLTVKSLKFGYAVCVYDEQAMIKAKTPQPDLLNYIMIALWRVSGHEIMIKQVSEDMGPAEINVPLKYVNAPCKATANQEYAIKWRQAVRDYHRKRNEQSKIAKTLQIGDRFFVYGQSYIYVRKAMRGKDCIIASNLDEGGKQYRIKPFQIEFEEIPLPEGFSLRR
jgi:hypothetical protein